MIEFTCVCSYEMTVDQLSHRHCGRIIADQDFGDVIDLYLKVINNAFEIDPNDKSGEIQRKKQQIPYELMNISLYGRRIYECPACRRIYIDDDNRSDRNIYEPADVSTNPSVLWSIKGEKWKGSLSGSWNKWSSDDMWHGTLEWNTNASQGTEVFDTWVQLEQAYHQRFDELLKHDLLRSAHLVNDETTIHLFRPDTESE